MVKYLAVALIAISLVGAGLFWGEVPAWRMGGAQVLPIEAVATKHDRPFCPEAGETIELRGDSHVAGGRMGSVAGLASLPYGRVMEQELGGEFPVLLRGRGGFAAGDGQEAWRNASPRGDVIIIAFGTNDAAPRGWMRNRAAVPLAEFEASLVSQINRETTRGAKVALLAPPPAGSQAINQRLQPYREAVARVGQSNGVAVFDPAEAFDECTASEPLLGYDALHFNASGHRCIGKWLASKICPTVTN